MITIFKIFDPYTGMYTDVYDEQELRQELGRRAWEAYMYMTQNLPFTVVTVNPDGSQVWRNAEGITIPNLDEMRKITGEQIKIPLTILGEPNDQ
jgi:hypothetical protein